ncbi:MAG: UDP-N-acetylglucosamine 4,6-dehydratase [Homavirus sp.]|uniref:UDP-N-acetylglucosamine 4,6-dehydratase n=1 Tax=Homavirus sp. TaxID=2487769 RepID=A0A3G5A718_9VIRU|nr:MAG: UDP-N-acetylglucosamine 4,6-dehydratase [Homavirus sp.]
MISNKTILIYGGTGSLGYEITSRYLDTNKIINYSRDEAKHWKMKLKYNSHKNLNFIIGDIRDKGRVKDSLLKSKPNIVIIAAAMKHIDQCELATHECIQTNLLGIKNILDSIDELQNDLNLETVCFISTDKACSPVNIYGMAKAMSEVLMVEKAHYIKSIKFVSVRYGNVLNSRGSIIPILHQIGKDNRVKEFKLTHINMTRFVMTLNQSVDLIEHAILKADSGDTVIPQLISMNVKDIIEIFSEIYNKPYVISGLRPGEKMLESLINETQSMRMYVDNDGYHIIKPHYFGKIINDDPREYNSRLNPLSKEELKQYLINLNLI